MHIKIWEYFLDKMAEAAKQKAILKCRLFRMTFNASFFFPPIVLKEAKQMY